MTITRLSLTLLGVVLLMSSGTAQESDYQLKKDFEASYDSIKVQIDAANTTAVLDTVAERIIDLEIRFAPRSAFLDKALYPKTLAQWISDLRSYHVITYDRVYLIQDRGIIIEELEGRIMLLTSKLDTLMFERDRLLQDLAESKKTVASLRSTIKQLSANMQAKDRLLFALVDSIFLPYNKSLGQLADVQKDAISRRLQKADVVGRIYDIASDNIRFLGMTQLQPKDYASLIDQHGQFAIKWTGLRDKINAVHTISEGKRGTQQTTGAAAGKGVKEPDLPPGAYVDSALTQWQKRLFDSFWSALAREFSAKGVNVRSFSDAQSFSASLRAVVDSMKTSGGDASVLVDEVWKDRIDKDWRDALSKETVLGKTEYASLDKLLSELGQKRIDTKFIVYLAVVLIIALAGWWFLRRKPQAPQQQSAK